MGYEKEDEPATLGKKRFIVETTAADGKLLGRDAFDSQADSDRHSKAMRAQGCTVAQSVVEPSAPDERKAPAARP